MPGIILVSAALWFYLSHLQQPEPTSHIFEGDRLVILGAGGERLWTLPKSGELTPEVYSNAQIYDAAQLFKIADCTVIAGAAQAIVIS